MISQLTEDELRRWQGFREFADRVIAPVAGSIDASQLLPPELIRELGTAGQLSALLPRKWGGGELTMTAYGMMCDEQGRTCSNVRNFVAVQDMVSDAIWRWGSEDHRRRWLPEIARGQKVAAFLLTEPGAGSDAQNIGTLARKDGTDVVVTGTKKWISFGQCADLLLVFAQYQGRHTAFLVEAGTPGIHIKPLNGMLGLRGSMLAEITFEDCRVPGDAIIGYPGSGLVFVASSALHIGRYSTAWGCAGLAQACLDESVAYAKERVQGGKTIGEHQLVQRMLADMLTETRAARLLCWQAGLASDREDADSHYQTLAAKYFASTSATRIASQAIQLQGAQGMRAGAVTERLFRDARAMEIIEGTTQVIQQLLGRWSLVARHPAAQTTCTKRSQA